MTGGRREHGYFSIFVVNVLAFDFFSRELPRSILSPITAVEEEEGNFVLDSSPTVGQSEVYR